MKLSEAQYYQRRISDLIKQLNRAIHEASIVGINVELDLYEEQKLSGVNTVVLDGKVTIKPQDIEDSLARFDADFVLMTGELQALIKQLITALGGEAKR